MYFVLVDLPYKGGSDRYVDHVKYSLFCAYDMKDMGQVLGDLMDDGAHVPGFFLALQIILCHKALSSEESEVQVSIRKSSFESWSEREKNDSVELQLAFEIIESERYYILSPPNCQQTMTANCTAQKFVLEMLIHFWRSDAA